MTLSGFLLALLSALSFSTLGLFAKLLYSQGFSVTQSLAWRFSLAALLLWLAVLVTGRLPKLRGRWKKPLLLGLFGFAPQAGLYFMVVRFLDPGMASLLLYLYPAFVILSGLLLYRKKPTLVQLAALILALVGSVLALWRSSDLPVQGLVGGLVLALAYGLYLSVSGRILGGHDSLATTAVIMGCASVVYWLLTLATGTVQIPADGKALAGLVGLACVATVLPIVTLFASMARIGAANASLVSSAEPIFTIALSAVLLGERLTLLQLAGGGCIVSALLVLQLGKRPAAPPAATGPTAPAPGAEG